MRWFSCEKHVCGSFSFKFSFDLHWNNNSGTENSRKKCLKVYPKKTQNKLLSFQVFSPIQKGKKVSLWVVWCEGKVCDKRKKKQREKFFIANLKSLKVQSLISKEEEEEEKRNVESIFIPKKVKIKEKFFIEGVVKSLC